MKLLLDECLPRKLKAVLTDQHPAATVPERGWAGKFNGELLRLAANEFDVFITVDQNLAYQQNLKEAQVAIVVLHAQDNRMASLRPLVPALLEALRTIQPGQLIRIGKEKQ